MPQKPLEGAQLAWMTVALAMATFMQVLDSTIANVAIPTIAGNLGSSNSQGTWVITSFGVANAISIPITGWLAKRIGEVRLFLWSTALFVLASWLCGISNSLGMLIFFRVIQGVVAGPLIPLSQSLLLNNYPPAKRAMALALWSMTVIVAPIFGPILGGYISDNYHWGWIFFINIPIGAFVIMAAMATLKGRETKTEIKPIDTVGLVLLIVGIGSLQVMLDQGKPGVVVTIIFALPPIVRLTILGIKQVPEDLIEAAESFGASPRQLLFKVQLPLAMPTIMAGVNQTLMLALSMVVIASMIAVGGLGQMVLRGIGRLDMGLAAVGGVGIVILAIILDRLTQSLGRDRRSKGIGRWYRRGPIGLLTRPFIKQA